MRELYRLELNHLGEDLERMARYVARTINSAADALRTGDLALIDQAIDADERIDDLADQIEASTMSLLARQAPVAFDLRMVIGAMKLAQTFERMGDLARHICHIAKSLSPEQMNNEQLSSLLLEMATQVSHTSHAMADLVANEDSDLATRIIDADDKIDELHLQVRKLVRDESVPLTRQQVISATLLSRFLERLGDHATKAAWRILFIRRGISTSYSDT
ncbi:phosphate signaling complex protein PhoU [Actinomycetaceae bacterium TAE3-ERU4]|nr:phosphate signaling complex protein PhoU [Actinomycetaceae bacterium TAE3-ERU4]